MKTLKSSHPALLAVCLHLIAFAPGGSLSISSLTVASDGSGDVLAVARKLAKERYAGWTYGSKQSSKQINCVQFVLAVIEELHGPVTTPTRDQIFVAGIPADGPRLVDLILNEDDRTKGVRKALLDLGRGKVVEPKDARPGDFIQYWMRRPDGSWFGHAAILEDVQLIDGIMQARIFGSHASTNGIATAKFWLRLSGTDRKVYLARYQ